MIGSPPSGATRSLFTVNRLGLPGYDLFVHANEVDDLRAKLRTVKLESISDVQQEVIRIENGVCKVGVDASEDNLPQEARLIHAISFTKGCYLGQEIVARLQYRGHVNKILVGLDFDSKEVPPLQSPALTSCVFSPKLGRPLGLGYIPYASNEVGRRVRIGDNEAEIVELPVNRHPVPA